MKDWKLSRNFHRLRGRIKWMAGRKAFAHRSMYFFFSGRRRHTRWNCDWSSDVCSSDLELLAQAGYPNGTDITLHSSSVDNRPIFEALGQMLTEVGLRTTVKMWDPGPAWNKFFQSEGKATNGQYGNWGNYSVFDADAVLHPLYHTEPGGWIGKHYARVEGLDKLIDEGRSSIDQAKRKRIYAEIQRMIREEAPSIFLYTQNDTLGISKKVAYEARPDEWLWPVAAKPVN